MAATEGPAGFEDFGLDDRLLKAVAKLGWAKPTQIQLEGIKEAMDGKDILARARTGSGKTGAYCLPTLHSILQEKLLTSRDVQAYIRALILVPTKELSQQTTKCVKDLSQFCSREIHVVDVSTDTALKTQKLTLASVPDVIVGTPARVVAHLSANNISLDRLKVLVIDEADLILSYGYEEDLTKLIDSLPKIRQTLLMSATLSTDVKSLEALVLRNPSVLELTEAHLPGHDQLLQHFIKCPSQDKLLVTYALLKFKLLRGKTLIFVNDIDRCYQLKLFLEQFSVRSCVLNSELPLNSRRHIVEQFNKGMYEYIIAADEPSSLLQDKGKKAKLDSGAGDDAADGEGDEEKQHESEESDGEDSQKKVTKKRKKGAVDTEFGVSRGVDFKGVKNVLNMDFPPTASQYIHRSGRTARGHNAGIALSLVTDADAPVLEAVKTMLGPNQGLQPYAFKMETISGLRYRAEDAMRAVSKNTVRTARRKEIEEEMLNSEKLKAHFEDNPRDLEVIRHDKALQHAAKICPELKDIPSYLMPKAIQSAPVRASTGARRGRGGSRGGRGRPPPRGKRSGDPLKTFSFAKRGEASKGKASA